jgi:excisionase family DNA binding protein
MNEDKTLDERIACRRTALTLREFAEALNISYKTVFEWASKGRLPAFQIGSNWRLDPLIAAKWIRDRCIPAVAGLERSISLAPPKNRWRELRQAGGNTVASKNNEKPKTLVEMIASRRTPLTLRDFAELFNLSYKTTWELASQGRIPVTRVGTTWRLEPTALEKWLREKTGVQTLPPNAK